MHIFCAPSLSVILYSLFSLPLRREGFTDLCASDVALASPHWLYAYLICISLNCTCRKGEEREKLLISVRSLIELWANAIVSNSKMCHLPGC
uniref:Secreted protein n=1 Tax=Astyanax mexicanus TaxID=7994 RepID=A0A8B9KP44_ASTMX